MYFAGFYASYFSFFISQSYCTNFGLVAVRAFILYVTEW